MLVSVIGVKKVAQQQKRFALIMRVPTEAKIQLRE